MKAKNVNISDSEWEVMKVLWATPNLTLKEVAAQLEHTEWSYTTVRTLVTRLVEKGAVGANKEQLNNFKYYPLVSESECKSREVKSFLQRVFDGSASMLVSNLTKDSNLTEEEQKKLLEIIEKM